jgi:hypothetical protein
MKRREVLLLLAAVSLAGACARDDAAAEPAWGKEPCAHCAMVLSDRRFGGQIVTSGGERLFFDDPGCMVLYLDERSVAPAHAWVREATTGQWLDARAARFVGGARSPMDFGFEARSSGGVGWDAMRASVAEKARSEQ